MDQTRTAAKCSKLKQARAKHAKNYCFLELNVLEADIVLAVLAPSFKVRVGEGSIRGRLRDIFKRHIHHVLTYAISITLD